MNNKNKGILVIIEKIKVIINGEPSYTSINQ